MKNKKTEPERNITDKKYNKKAVIYRITALTMAVVAIVVSILLLIKFKPFSNAALLFSKSAFQTFNTDFDYKQFQIKFLKFDYIDDCNFSKSGNPSTSLRYCLNILYLNNKIKLDKDGLFPVEYDDDKSFINVIKDYYGVNEPVQNYFPYKMYISGKVTFTDEFHIKPLSKTLDYKIKSITKTSDANHFYTVNCEATDRATGIKINNTAFTVYYDKKSMYLKIVKINPENKLLIKPLTKTNNLSFNYYHSVIIDNHKLLYYDLAKLTLIDVDTLKTVATAAIDSNGYKGEFYIQKCKAGENKIIVATYDKVYVFDNNLNRINVIDVPKIVRNDFYDISTDLSMFCYHADNGIYYADTKLKNPHLIVKDEKPQKNNNNQKEKYYMIDGFEYNDSKIVYNSYEFNVQNQSCVYDISTKAIKKFNINKGNDTRVITNNDKQYYIKKNNSFDVIDYKNITMTTDNSADIPVGIGNSASNMIPSINGNDIYYITEKGFIYYLNCYNTETKKCNKKPLCIGYMPEIQSVLPDGRIVISYVMYYSIVCYNFNISSNDDF